MSIKNKVIIIVVLVGMVYILTDFLICRFLVLPNFIELERMEAQKDVERIVAAIEREIYHLDQFTTDWAYWDDAYLFIQDRNNEFIASNLSATAVFSENNLNLISFIDLEGTVIWGKSFNLTMGSGLGTLQGDSVPGSRSLLHGREDNKSRSGFLLTNYGVLIISTAPILKSNLTGPANGTLMMGRIINEEDARTLSEQTKLDLRLWSIDDPSIPKTDRDMLIKARQEDGQRISITQVSDAILHCHILFNDLNHQPALLARVAIPRGIAQQGEKVVFFTTFSIAIAGTLFVFLLLLLLTVNVSKPISRLTKTINQISDGEKPDLHSNASRTDEIGILAKEFNSLIEKLDHQIRDHKQAIDDLKTALSEIKTLRGLLPICSHCKKIRDDSGLWNRIEAYISQHSHAEFSHGICPECIEKYYIKNYENAASKKD